MVRIAKTGGCIKDGPGCRAWRRHSECALRYPIRDNLGELRDQRIDMRLDHVARIHRQRQIGGEEFWVVEHRRRLVKIS